MKSDKECPVNERSKGCWLEFLGIILLIIATILTIVTANGIAILGMYLVGLILSCYKCLAHCCSHHHCCSTHDHCHDEDACTMPSEKKTTTKKTTSKPKAKTK